MQVTILKRSVQIRKARQGILTSLFCFYTPLLLCVLSLSSCSKKEETLFFSGNTMGTTYHITLVPGELGKQNTSTLKPLDKDELEEGIQKVLDAVNQSMSTYISTSELSILNDDKTGEWLSVSPTLAFVLSKAIEIGELSVGALDVTIGPLVNLWGFGSNNSVITAPSDEEIKLLESVIGLNKLEFNFSDSTLKKPVGMQIDLSSIAKGYGADAIAEFFLQSGYENYLIEVGGEIVTKGRNTHGQKWRIGVEKPALDHQGVQQAIAVSGKGIATSGDYRNYFEQDGVRFSHIIDPRTGYPVKNSLASVTVIAETGAIADGLATAFTVLGEQKSFELARQHDIAVYAIIRRDNGFVAEYSEAFSVYLNDKN
ncbi:MAG: FAD:protein FMN transferase [Cellvibrionaceae bacterium]